MKRCLLCVLILTAVSALAPVPILAADSGNPNPGVIPPTAKVADQNGVPLTYADWGDRYTQWRFSVPCSADLLANPSLGQDPASPVFFVPSAIGAVAATPPFSLAGEVTVPAGKMLLLPVTWVAGQKVPLDCCPLTLDQFLVCMPVLLDSLLDPAAAGELYASLDGLPFVSLTQYRAHSAQPFRINWAADLSRRGLQQSLGMMVNYLYELREIEANHDRFLQGRIMASRQVTSLVRER